MEYKQRTVKSDVVFDGIGIHSGLRCAVVVKPLPAGSGIVLHNARFPDKDIKIGLIVPENQQYATILRGLGWQVSTIEHLMAALYACRIDNAQLEFEGVEAPILDGSAKPFMDKFLAVGLAEQAEDASYITPLEPVVFACEEQDRYMKISKAKQIEGKVLDTALYIDYEASFDHPDLGQAAIKCKLTEDFFLQEVAPARTFGFVDQLPQLRKMGLAKGASLENTVVIGEAGFMNMPRFEDEFMRHKLLDLVGDVALLGARLCGHIEARRTGHAFNRQIIEHFTKHPEKWAEVKASI